MNRRVPPRRMGPNGQGLPAWVQDESCAERYISGRCNGRTVRSPPVAFSSAPYTRCKADPVGRRGLSRDGKQELSWAALSPRAEKLVNQGRFIESIA